VFAGNLARRREIDTTMLFLISCVWGFATRDLGDF
jgi:hypothetical protein